MSSGNSDFPVLCVSLTVLPQSMKSARLLSLTRRRVWTGNKTISIGYFQLW